MRRCPDRAVCCAEKDARGANRSSDGIEDLTKFDTQTLIILWIIHSFYFRPCANLLKVSFKISTARCLVFEISAFQFVACHCFRAGAGFHITMTS